MNKMTLLSSYLSNHFKLFLYTNNELIEKEIRKTISFTVTSKRIKDLEEKSSIITSYFTIFLWMFSKLSMLEKRINWWKLGLVNIRCEMTGISYLMSGYEEHSWGFQPITDKHMPLPGGSAGWRVVLYTSRGCDQFTFWSAHIVGCGFDPQIRAHKGGKKWMFLSHQGFSHFEKTNKHILEWGLRRKKKKKEKYICHGHVP